MEELTNNKFKYICETCKFKCNEKARWTKHIKTSKHINGKRKIRSDYNGPYKCLECKFETNNATYFKQHNLNKHSNQNTRENGFKYYCKICDFGTFSKFLFETHKTLKKHIVREKNYV